MGYLLGLVISDLLLVELYQERQGQQGKYFDLMINPTYFSIPLWIGRGRHGKTPAGPGRNTSAQIQDLAKPLCRCEGGSLGRSSAAEAVKHDGALLIQLLDRHGQEMQREMLGTIDNAPRHLCRRAHINQGKRLTLLTQCLELVRGNFLKAVHKVFFHRQYD
jgi:hypothetical protein